MIKLFKKLGVDFVEPLNRFEQLEERIVLDASISNVPDPPPDPGVDVDEDTGNLSVNPESQGENDPTADLQYGLEIGDENGANFVTVDNWNSGTSGAAIQFDPTSGQITWAPNDADMGSGSSDTNTLTFKVTSQQTLPAPDTDEVTFLVNVKNTLDWDTGFSLSVDEDDDSWSANVQTDSETYGHDMDYSSADKPGWLLIDADTGEITIDSGAYPNGPDQGLVGDHQFNLAVLDEDTGETLTELFTLTVVNTVDFDGPFTFSLDEDDPNWTDDVQTDSETAGNNMDYSSGDKPAWLLINAETGALSIDTGSFPGGP
ncbi:hypothetical protein ACFL2Q_19655, partial [Thermodesulfobacteriota bacterium]